MPPVQPSVVLETYLEEVKIQLAEIEISKPRNNLPNKERLAIKELKQNPNINIKKADKGTSTVIMNKEDKIHEGQIQLDVKENYKPLATPMVAETSQRVTQLIKALYHGNHIDAMTEKWLSLTPNPPRIPVFYTLPKIHKPKPVGRPIILGCDGPTERISAFVDNLLQPIAKVQKSYLKDTTDFINFLEKTKVVENTVLVSMDVAIYKHSTGGRTACFRRSDSGGGTRKPPCRYIINSTDYSLTVHAVVFQDTLVSVIPAL